MLKNAFVPLAGAGILLSLSAFQTLAADSIVSELGLSPNAHITGGNGSDTLTEQEVIDGRTDPNVTSSRFTGVVSLNPVINGDSFICTGTVISKTHILTAAHCVDTDGQGNVMNVGSPDNSLAVLFNNDGAYYDSGNVIFAENVVIHPDYEGFNICPDGSAGCVNDDLAVITLSEEIPDDVEIYDFYTTPVEASSGTVNGDEFTFVGYGTRGDGYWGYYTNFGLPIGNPTFDEKLVGGNIVDLIDLDDEQGFVAGEAEVWYADFDGYDAFFDSDIDYICDNYQICGPWLAEDVESNIGGGDSGGPSFVYDSLSDKYLLAGVNTFGIDTGWAPGAFGSLLGGILVESYLGWITASVVSAPAAIILLLLSFIGIRLRRKA